MPQSNRAINLLVFFSFARTDWPDPKSIPFFVRPVQSAESISKFYQQNDGMFGINRKLSTKDRISILYLQNQSALTNPKPNLSLISFNVELSFPKLPLLLKQLDLLSFHPHPVPLLGGALPKTHQHFAVQPVSLVVALS